jgi:ubiquinol-cytochrome c reductase core subunit 2
MRESELLGGQLTAYHTRESLVIEAKFLREDLPYFTELLGEVVSSTKYTGKHIVGTTENSPDILD